MVALSFSSLTTAALLDGIRCETRRGWLGCKGRERGSYLISREAAALSPLFFSLSVHRAPAAPGPIDDRAQNVAPPPRILLGQRRRRCSHITISNFHSFLPTWPAAPLDGSSRHFLLESNCFEEVKNLLERHSKFNGDWIKSYAGGSASKKRTQNPWAFFFFFSPSLHYLIGREWVWLKLLFYS